MADLMLLDPWMRNPTRVKITAERATGFITEDAKGIVHWAPKGSPRIIETINGYTITEAERPRYAFDDLFKPGDY